MTENQLQAVDEARRILGDVGLGKYATTDRNVLTFLSLVGMQPGQSWRTVTPVAVGISPIIEFISAHYGVDYAPNTRETIRKDAVKPLERLNVIERNSTDPGRPTNSPRTDYLLDPRLTKVLQQFGSDRWSAFAKRYSDQLPTEASLRPQRRVSEPVRLPNGTSLNLSPGPHSRLIKAIVEEFTHFFLPDGALVAYIGDTADNRSLTDDELLRQLGIDFGNAPEKPDVILWYPHRQWLIYLYLEAIHSSGHFDVARKEALRNLSGAHVPIFVSCFQNRRAAARAFATIAPQTEVWIADEPSHLIHFDGERFLGPYR